MTDTPITNEIAHHKHLRGQVVNEQVANGQITTQDFQGSAPQWIIPGVNAPPDKAWMSHSKYVPDASFLFNQSNPGMDVIPTLQTGQPANQSDQSTYPINSATAQLTEQNRNSIVQVYGHDQGQPRDEDLAGTGFFIDTQGDLVTAYHVVSGIDGPIDVSTADGIVHQATVLGTDPKSDLAILSIDSYNSTQPVSLETNTAALKRGDSLTAIGHPEGWTDLYISPGTYSGTTRIGNLAKGDDLNGANPNQSMIAADMNTQQGNSGSPVFNPSGQVVGMVDRGDNGSHSYMVPASAIVALAQGQPDSETALTSAADNPAPNTNLTPDTNSNPNKTPYSSYSNPDANPYTFNTSQPGSFSRPSNTGLYEGGMAVTAGSRLLLPDSFALKGTIGRMGMIFSAYTGAEDLFHHDARAMYNSFEYGSTRAQVRSSLSVAADGLLIGAAVASYVPQLRAASVGVSLAGSLLKIGNRVVH